MVLGLVAKVHMESMNTVTWMKKNVFFAELLAMVPVAKAHTESTSMVVEPINVFIAELLAQAHVAKAHMESMKSKSA